jgi:NAD(P)-dependent dehydrogenase (short-subunit alcohol dehydrogenase family)
MAVSKWTAEQIPSQSGKTVLITGANSGIGYQAAKEMARHGAHVLLGCRDAAKGQAALERLEREAPGASAEVVLLDMASLTSIRSFAAGFAARAVPLDVLINNAGVMALPTREMTADGFERQFGTNHLGHFALTGLLMPQLLAAPAPRVVTVASLAHRNGKIHFENLQRRGPQRADVRGGSESERQYKPWDAYAESKLANILFSNELDRRARTAQSRLMSVAVHPGVSRTSIFENGPGSGGLKAMVMKVLAPVLMQSDDAGALPTLFAATSPNAHGGEYIGPDGFQELKGSPTVVKPKPQALDEDVARRLWTVSEELTGVVYPALG